VESYTVNVLENI